MRTLSERTDRFARLHDRLDAELRRGFAIALPAQTGPGWDGEHTVRLLVKSMIDALQPLFGAPTPDVPAAVMERLQAMHAQLNAELAALAEQGRLMMPPVALDEAPLLSDLRRRLLAQGLPSAIAGAESPPIIAVGSASGRELLTAAPALQVAGGLRRAQIHLTATAPEWDAERQTFAVAEPELLQISGTLDAHALRELRNLLTDWDGAPEPPLIVLADALDLELQAMLEARSYVVLPPPPAQILAALPALIAGVHWSFSRLRAARIDAESAVLALSEADTPGEPTPAPQSGWTFRHALLLETPHAHHSERFQAEQALQWRIDAEAGLVAGGGATLAWLARRLAPSPEQSIWQEALYAPMHQIIVNLIGAERAEPAFAQALEWVTSGAAPAHTYFVPAATPGRLPLLVFGDCRELGSLTPLRLIERMIRDTCELVLQHAAIEVLANVEPRKSIEQVYTAVAPAIQAGVAHLEVAARSSYAWIEGLWQRRPRLYLDWPAHGRPVPAAGLYYYVEHDGRLVEHMIGFDGMPRPTQAAEPIPVAHIAELTAQTGASGAHRLFRVPTAEPNDPPAYLATCRLSGDVRSAVRLVEAGFAPPINPSQLVIKPEFRAELVCALRERREQGYLAVPHRLRTLPDDNALLAERAGPFWETLAIVSDKLIAAIERQLADPLGAAGFTNPCVVFHLNRVLSEGFIEGHAAAGLLPTAGYAQGKAAAAAWRSALDYARSAEPISYAQLRRPERLILGLIWRSIAHSEPPRDPTGFRPLRHLFNLATPGVGDEQNIVFWSMHYPHWQHDLVDGLRELAGQGLTLSDQDITGIAGVIVDSLASNRTDHLAALTGVIAQELNLPMAEAIIRHFARIAGAYKGASEAEVSLWQKLVGAVTTLFVRAWGFLAQIRLRLRPAATDERRSDEVTG